MILFCGFNGFSEKIIATMMVIHFWGLFLFDFLGPLNIWMISNKSFRVDCVLFVTFSCATLLLKYSHTNLVKKHCNRVYTHTHLVRRCIQLMDWWICARVWPLNGFEWWKCDVQAIFALSFGFFCLFSLILCESVNFVLSSPIGFSDCVPNFIGFLSVW